MKKIILIIICIFEIALCYGQSSENTVNQFGNNMKNWCTTRKYHNRKKIKDLCTESCRVFDYFMEDYRIKNNLNLASNYIDSYLDCFQHAFKKGDLFVNFNDVRIISAAEQSYSTSIEAQEKIRAKNISTISTNIVISGALSFNTKDVFYVQNGKVVKIEPYEEIIDPESGKKKVKVNFSDLVKERSIELSYGYSSHYPLNLALHTNFSHFNIGIEYGQNFSNEPLYSVNHTNFAKSTVDGKYFYLLASPGVYLRYASIDCGLGGVFTKYDYKSVYTADKKSNTYFMLKPKATFHIPIYSEDNNNVRVYLSPHVAYQCVPKFSKLNCLEFGLGIRVNFETY